MKQLTLFGDVLGEKKPNTADLKANLIAKCFYYRDGLCYFLQSAPSECCALCWNWKTVDTRGLIDLYTLLTKDARYKKAIFPEGNVVQKTIQEG